MRGYTYIEEGGRGGERRRRRRRPKRQTCLASTRPEAHHRCLDLRISVDRRLMPRTRHTVGGRGVEGWERNRQPVGCRGGFGQGGGLIWGQPREYPSSFCELIARPSASTASSFAPSPLPSPLRAPTSTTSCAPARSTFPSTFYPLCAPRHEYRQAIRDSSLYPRPRRRMLPSSGGSPTEDVSCEPRV